MKLTPEQNKKIGKPPILDHQEIIKLYQNKTIDEIAEQFGVSKQDIYNIIKLYFKPSYKSEKRRIEQAFIFIQLRFVIKYAIDFKEESTREEKLKIVEDQIIKILEPESNKQLVKMQNRISKLNQESGIKKMLLSGVDGQKFILIIYFLVLEIIKLNNLIFPQELQKIFNDLLEIENYNKKEYERMKLRSEAHDEAPKLLKKLQKLDYYLK